MNLGRHIIKTFFTIMFLIIGIFSLVTWHTYQMACETIDSVFPELTRLVAEDNCLDNTVDVSGGNTMYQIYRNKLDTISANSKIMKFEDDAISVPYTSRDTAPQKGTIIPVKLKGVWKITLPLYGGWDINFPIERTVDVIGIRYYRDR